MMNPGIATAARGMGAGPIPGGIATPMMAQPMMAQPMMAQPMMAGQPVAQPAASQGLASAVAPLLGRSSKELLPVFAANPNYATLAALSKAQEQEQIAAQVRGQQAIEAAKQMQGSVAQDVVKKVASSGVGAQPYGFARGGIVAFQGGGLTKDDLERLDEDLVAEEEPWERELRRMQGEDVPEPGAGSVYRAIGRALSYNSDVAAQRKREAQERAIQQAYRDPSRARDVAPPAAVPAATVARPAGAGPAARPPGAGIGGAGPVTRPARPPAATAGAAAPDDPYGLRVASADMFRTMQGAGTVSDEEKQFRQALLEAMQAERQPPQEYKEPKGVSGRELLELAGSLNLEKGEGFGSLARGTAGILEKREAKKTEAMKANREIDAANRKLRTAVAQQQLAYASGDRQAKQAADAAVAKARYDLRVAEVKLGLESRKVGAQERTAGAAETSARTRAATSAGNVDFKTDVEVRKAIAAAQKAHPIFPGVRDPAINNAQIQRQINMVADQVAPLGVTREQVVGYFSTSGQASAAPGASADPLGIR